VPGNETAGAGGVAGNARLTGGTAVLLLALLALEGATIPFIGSLLRPHVFIGMALIPPVLLKLGSTGYRFLRYYAGDLAYRLKGPPALPLRLMAPALVAATLALLGTGVALIAAGRSNSLVFLHKFSFIAWLALMSVHVLSHLGGLPRLALADWRPAPVPGSGGGAAARIAAIAASLLAGCVLPLLTLRGLSPWH
jgi:hypothetical protein